MQDQVADKLEAPAGARAVRPRQDLHAARRHRHPGAAQGHGAAEGGRRRLVPGAEKLNDSRPTLPQGVQGPFFNDEYGDVYSAIYMLSGPDVSLAKLKDYAEIAPAPLRTDGVAKVDIVGVRDQRIFIEFSHRKLATLGITRRPFSTRSRAKRGDAAGTVETSADRIDVRVTGAFKGEAAIAEVPIEAASHVLARRHCHDQARPRGSAEQHRAPQRQ